MEQDELAISVAGPLIAAALGLAAQDASSPSSPRDVDFARDMVPLLRGTCVDCHGGREPQSGLSFESFTGEGLKSEAAARKQVGVWVKVREKLERGEMPPPESPAADAGEVARALGWLNVRLGSGEGAWPLDPGRVTIRRLNRAEYANTIRDLFDLEPGDGAPDGFMDGFMAGAMHGVDVASHLPPDEVGYGFDNIGDVLSLPPLLLEKYATVAEEIARAALPGDDVRRAQLRHFEAERVGNSLDRAIQQETVGLYSNGDVHTEVVLPRAGDYLIRVRASADQAGPEVAQLGLASGRTQLAKIDVPIAQPAFDAYEWRGRLEGGKQRIAVQFLNDFYNPSDADPGQRDRNLIVDWFDVEGPLDDLPPTRSERRVYVCSLGPGRSPQGHLHSRACAPDILKKLASRAWRRPATELEIARLMPFVDGALADGDGFVPALRTAVAAVLVSPNFLFRTELDASPNDPTAVHDLTDFELASRLSYLLWSSLPDDRLFTLAEQGLLREQATLASEMRRMLRDPRASALVTNFAAQWLELRSLDRVSPDAQLFPEFDDALREAMRLETEMFVEAILREGRPIRELLDADFTFLNERLARLYGIPGVKGERMRRVRLPKDEHGPARGGVLTQASLLTLTSNPTRTSPVKRGKFLLERVLGAPPPPPPPGVGALDESPQAVQASSLKERMELHRTKPDCAVCHARMDALGFALEGFGPIGAARTNDGAHPVDDRTVLPDGRTIDGAIGLKQLVLEDDAFTRCVAEKLLIYAIGRGPTDDDRRALAMLVKSYRGRSPTFEELLGDLLQLDAFRRRRGE